MDKAKEAADFFLCLLLAVMMRISLDVTRTQRDLPHSLDLAPRLLLELCFVVGFFLSLSSAYAATALRPATAGWRNFRLVETIINLRKLSTSIH